MNNLLANTIEWKTVGIIILIVAVIAVLFAALIVLVYKLCYVKGDEKAEKITEKLAGANCGGCGFKGCADFAKALSEGKADINSCNATSNESKAEIAEILGIPFSRGEEKIAKVLCAGGNLALDKFKYLGNLDCNSEKNYQGGRKVCANGCLGNGNCVNVCSNNGIKIVDGVAVIDDSVCTACGACKNACPKKLIDLIPKKAVVYIACSNTCKGKDALNACKVSCIGCGMCEKVCPSGAIKLINNLPVIDYSKCTGCKTCADKCVRKCIKVL